MKINWQDFFDQQTENKRMMERWLNEMDRQRKNEYKRKN